MIIKIPERGNILKKREKIIKETMQFPKYKIKYYKPLE